MRLENNKPKCITIDAFYELAERESELWELIDRPAGGQNALLRESLLAHWQEFKRALKAQQKADGTLPTRDEVVRLFAESFSPSSNPLNDVDPRTRLS